MFNVRFGVVDAMFVYVKFNSCQHGCGWTHRFPLFVFNCFSRFFFQILLHFQSLFLQCVLKVNSMFSMFIFFHAQIIFSIQILNFKTKHTHKHI